MEDIAQGTFMADSSATLWTRGKQHMRKRIGSVLLTVCLLLGLLPTTALAGGPGMDVSYDTFEEFQTAVAESTATPVYVSNCKFTWPTTHEILTVKRPIQIDVETCSWEIPANIDLIFLDQGKIQAQGGFDSSLTIRGTVTCPSDQSMPKFQLFSAQGNQNTLTISSGAEIIGGFYINDNLTCIVESGAKVSLNDTVMLGGTLTGKGGQVGTVDINNTYSNWNGENWTAVIGGDLTAAKLEVSPSDTQDLASDLIISAGSKINLTGALSISGYSETPKLLLNGTLTISGMQDQIRGVIELGNDGILVLSPGTNLYDYGDVGGRKITGSGTIKAYANVDGNVINGMPVIWGEVPIIEVLQNRAAYKEQIAESVKIWCDWENSCDHQWTEDSRTEATCTATGQIVYICSQCNETKTEPIPALGHDLTYTTNGSTITEDCQREDCDHTATATLSAADGVYTGQVVENAEVAYGEGWAGGDLTITYSDNINAGTAGASITAGEASANVTFQIARAVHTLSLANLSQTSGNVSAVTCTVSPADSTAKVTVEYQVGGQWTDQLPTAVGSYPVRARVAESDNLVLADVGTYTIGTLIISQRSSGGGSTGSSSSSGNKTEVEKNPDGSTTTTVTKPNGTVTETTKYPDGSQAVVETKKDGTVTTTTTDKTGNETEVVENTDGTTRTTITNEDGSSSVTKMDKDGKVETQVKLPSAVVEDAAQKGQAVALPMPSVSASSNRDEAPTVTVDLPRNTTAKVEIPVEDVTPGTVAVQVKADGTEEIIKTSLTTDGGVTVTLSDGDTVKIVENSRDFADVPDAHWASEAVDFAASRELFAGTSDTTFAPEVAMNRAMIVTVLARFEGVDTSGGDSWYEAGQQWAVENGISDGTSLDQNLTREQLVTMLWRYAGSPIIEVGLGDYPDCDSVSSWAVRAMAWAVNAGIITGADGRTLAPQGVASRAQVAAILMRFVETTV